MADIDELQTSVRLDGGEIVSANLVVVADGRSYIPSFLYRPHFDTGVLELHPLLEPSCNQTSTSYLAVSTII